MSEIVKEPVKTCPYCIQGVYYYHEFCENWAIQKRMWCGVCKGTGRVRGLPPTFGSSKRKRTLTGGSGKCP